MFRVARYRWIWWVVLSLIAMPSAYALPGASRFYVLNPRMQTGQLEVISLVDKNSIRVGSQVVTLDAGQTAKLQGSDLVPGAVISGEGAFSLGSALDATDLPVPEYFLGTQFVVPHFRDSHSYFLLSPHEDATATISINGLAISQSLPKGVVVEFDAGSTNGVSGIIRSDRPILVSHSALNNSRDVYPVPPAAKELWGVRSNSAVVGALEDNTSITVYGSSGATETVVLSAGGYYSLKVPNGSQGTGSGVHLVADKPIAAVQVADGDGVEATSFWPAAFMGSHYAIPVDAQYVAVVCPGNANVELKDAGATVSQVCMGDGIVPGKVFFGSTSSGVGVGAGASITADGPVYLYYESSAKGDEHNLTGRGYRFNVLNPRAQWSSPKSAVKFPS